MSSEYEIFEIFDESEWERYGFRGQTYLLTKDEQFTKLESDRTLAWTNIHICSSQNQSSKELLWLIRKGVPDSRRRKVWLVISGAYEFMQRNPNFYQQTLNACYGSRIPKRFAKVPTFGSDPFGTKTFGTSSSFSSFSSSSHSQEPISQTKNPTDNISPGTSPIRGSLIMSGHPASGVGISTIPDLSSFYGSPPKNRDSFSGINELSVFEALSNDYFLSIDGYNMAARILCTLALTHPESDYCPKLPDIILVLLHFLSEEECFIIGHLILLQSRSSDSERWRGSYTMLSQTKKEFTLFQLTFIDILKAKNPELYSHMDSLGVDPFSIVGDWFTRIFVGSIPFQAVLHVFDCFLNEGGKILYRTAYGLLKLNRSQLLQTKDKSQFLSTLSSSCSTIDGDTLIKVAYKTHLTRRHFEKFDQKNRKRVEDVIEPTVSSYFRPKITTPSSIIKDEDFEKLWAFLPSALRIEDPILVFVPETHGYNLGVMYRLLEDTHPLIFLIQSSNNEKFGLFLPYSMQQKRGHSQRECFIFTLGETFQKYEWTGGAEPIVIFQKNNLSIGGGGSMAFTIDDELYKGTTDPSPAFENPPLCSVSPFTISKLEVFSCK